MKVLMINNYHFLKGGSEKVYFETARLLRKKGHEVIFFSTKDPDNFDSVYDNYFVDAKNYGKFSIRSVVSFFYSRQTAQKLKKLIEKEKPDIAHLHIFYGRLTSSILPVLKEYNIPVVMTVHEYKMLCPMYLFLDNSGNICEKCAGGNYYYCFLKKCNRGNLAYSLLSALECYFRDIFIPWEKYIDKFIMVSKFVLKKHLDYKPFLKNKVVQIYNFVDLNSFTPSYSHNGYYLYFGRLSREKGLLTLLKAWQNFPNLKLKIVGAGPQDREIKTFVQENAMQNVEMLGFRTGDELKKIINNAKFIIVPSEWYETFGLNIVESFASGKPVIGANIGGIPELVKDSFTGFLFESGNFESLKNSIERAEAIAENEYSILSRNARKFAEEHFSEEKYYTKLIEVYSYLLKQRGEL